ncbi:unnamed protein product [Thelazia callipaeda]|uniref:LEM domain-containing protein n=1 Tax=Thelazia callipaeda TaxID=103827 RepID=A0A0N5CKZ3_THECL|nr:unnamed protein product [Thelazia callipaeda]
MEVDFDNYSNEKIRDELILRGLDPGPVVETTRNVYVNKLRRLINESNSMESSQGNESTALSTPDDYGFESSEHNTEVHKSQVTDPLKYVSHAAKHEEAVLSQAHHTPLTPSKIPVRQPKSRLVFNSNPSEKKHTYSMLREYSSELFDSAKCELTANTRLNCEPSHNRSNFILQSESVSTYESPNTSKLTKSNQFDKHSTAWEGYRVTPTKYFTSLQDNRTNQEVYECSDDEMYGEESSRTIPSYWENEFKDLTEQSLRSNCSSRGNQGQKLIKGKFENSYSEYGNGNDKLYQDVQDKSVPRSYPKIGLTLIFGIIFITFIFFFAQHYVDEQDAGNREEI